jgi:hypothetical protein
VRALPSLCLPAISHTRCTQGKEAAESEEALKREREKAAKDLKDSPVSRAAKKRGPPGLGGQGEGGIGVLPSLSLSDEVRVCLNGSVCVHEERHRVVGRSATCLDMAQYTHARAQL